MRSPLPYHCPTFKTDHLLEPCTKNLARVKYLKLAKKHIGPLEKCVECKGKMLVTKPRTVIEGLPAPENWIEERFVNPEPKEYASPERKGWEPHPEVTTAPLFLRTQEEPIAHYPPRGRNLGKKYKKREKILPEAPNIVQAKPEVLVLEKVMPEYPRGHASPETKLEINAPPGARFCPTHPEVLQRVDKLGRWMGMCAECLSDRGRRCGLENVERGITAPPVSIPLNLPRYAEIKKWLAEQADLNERTLQKEIMMVLKTAWRQGI